MRSLNRMTTHLLNRKEFAANRARDRSANRSSFCLIGSTLEAEVAHPSHRSALPYMPMISMVELERGGIATGGNPKVVPPRYGPATEPLATSPTAVNPALRDTTRPGLWRTPVSPQQRQRLDVSPKARQLRRQQQQQQQQQQNPCSEVENTRTRHSGTSTSNDPSTNSFGISSGNALAMTRPTEGLTVSALSPSLSSSSISPLLPSSSSSLSKSTYVRNDPVVSSVGQIKSVDIWPRTQQYVMVSTAEQERQDKLAANRILRGTLTREELTGGYNEPRPDRSRLQEDYNWPCEKSSVNHFVRGGGLEHTAGHGHALACEHMKGFRGSNSRFSQMSNGVDIRHDQGPTQKSHIKTFRKS